MERTGHPQIREIQRSRDPDTHKSVQICSLASPKDPDTHKSEQICSLASLRKL